MLKPEDISTILLEKTFQQCPIDSTIRNSKDEVSWRLPSDWVRSSGKTRSEFMELLQELQSLQELV